jgi:multidrug resistance efflux pump
MLYARGHVAVCGGRVPVLLSQRQIYATNQAYLKADVTWLTAQYAGEITALYVYNGQVVQAQQPLLELIDVQCAAASDQQQALSRCQTKCAFDVHEQNEQAQQALTCRCAK